LYKKTPINPKAVRLSIDERHRSKFLQVFTVSYANLQNMQPVISQIMSRHLDLYAFLLCSLHYNITQEKKKCNVSASKIQKNMKMLLTMSAVRLYNKPKKSTAKAL
jgi:hypothetical protein